MLEVNPKIEFKYMEYSNNIFTKIQLVNAFTQKEINILNENYKKLGLFIQQVKVDNFGNQISPNEFSPENNFLNKKRRLIKKLKELYKKSCINDKNKYLNSSNKSINQSSNIKNNDEDKLCKKEDLISWHNNLYSIYEDCQNIDFKKCKIDDEKFKIEIIKFIKRHRKYITEKRYTALFNKWRNKNMNIKGCNPSDCIDLSSWKIPILKGFKSELSLYATLNTIRKKIGKENNSEDNEEDKNISLENKNDKEESEEGQSESSYSSDNYFKGNQNIPKNQDNENDLDEQ